MKGILISLWFILNIFLIYGQNTLQSDNSNIYSCNFSALKLANNYKPSIILNDTLIYKIINEEENNKNYSVNFVYVKFDNNFNKLNKIIEDLIYDSLGSSIKYFNSNLDEYNEYFKNEKKENIYRWKDLKEISIVFNSNKIISFINSDIQWRSGGAIGFGTNIGFNYDVINNKLIEFNEIIDSSKINDLSKILEICYRDSLEKEEKNKSLIEIGWDTDKIKVTKNICITEKGIDFLYDRFEDVPYATGLVIFVPYNRIKKMLLPNTVLVKLF